MSQIGVTGLAVMGANLARNIARRGVPIAVHNRTASKTRDFLDEFSSEGDFTGSESLEEFVAALERPRRIIVMVKAGKPVDGVIADLVPLLDQDDIIIDAGNSHFADTRRREAELTEQGLRFIGTGVSGGEEGALNGPSIMPGGPREAYGEVEEIFTTIAAQVDGEPCCAYIGADGAGHYVKMVHNGIEYADMQLIAEAYDLLRHGIGLDVPTIKGIFDDWNAGDLESFLIEITATVLDKVDAETGKPLVDVIVDQAEQKGTGRWTAQDALELGVPLTGITEAVFARSLSALRDQRRDAAGVLAGPKPGGPATSRWSTTSARRCTPPRSSPTRRASSRWPPPRSTYDWDLQMGELAKIWRGGCIIRARFLNRITESYAEHPGPGEPADGAVLPRRRRRRPGRLAQGDRARRRAGRRGARVLVLAGLLRRLPPRARPGEPDPGPARLLRRPHLPARGQGRLLPHALVAGRV